MKKITTILFIALFILINTINHPSFAAISPPVISAPSGILIDADTGDILYEKNAHEPMYPASTTKIVTGILTLENAKLEDIVTIDKDTPFTDGNRIYVIEDENLTVEQLLYASMVESANDAAVALAKHISGDVEGFAALMNKRAKELGAKNTHFTNPNGLPDSNHTTTTYDMAMIAKYGMTLPKFREIVSTVRYQIPPTNKQEEIRYLKTSNRFLWGTGSSNKMNYKGNWIDIKYDLIEGIKTGYTNDAQQCLITSGKKDGHRLISVVFKAEGRNIYTDSRALIDYGFENFDHIKITDGGKKITSRTVKYGQQKEVDLITQSPLFITIPKDQKMGAITPAFEVAEELVAPITKGDVLGKVIYHSGEKYLGEVNLVAGQDIEEKTGITSIFLGKQNPKWSIVHYFLFLIFIYLGWRTIVTVNRLKKKRNTKILKKIANP